MTTDTDDTRGGTQWELETAGKSMIAARHAGDVDGEVLALLRFSEGLRNSSLGVVGQVLAPLSKEIHEQKTALDTLVNTMQHIAATVVSIAAAQKKSDARLAHVEQQIKESQDDRQALHDEVAQIDTKVGQLQSRLDAYIAGSKRDQVEDLRREIDALKQARGDGPQ